MPEIPIGIQNVKYTFLKPCYSVKTRFERNCQMPIEYTHTTTCSLRYSFLKSSKSDRNTRARPFIFVIFFLSHFAYFSKLSHFYIFSMFAQFCCVMQNHLCLPNHKVSPSKFVGLTSPTYLVIKQALQRCTLTIQASSSPSTNSPSVLRTWPLCVVGKSSHRNFGLRNFVG